ncbi:cystatin domain-containing protein [Chitinibacter sp. ZOR0017]|uniref:cystatin domain-containing protein n=1 Tax=Chitinibacter sp. ZOR0017 TaxID=1339254 RepID=UPI000691C849|nr:cystatin domain-containing protein [Chitinibacter sp. ZOR0017]
MRTALLSVLAITTLSACAASTPTPPTNCLPANLAGSYHPQTSVSPEAEEAAAVALRQMNTSAKLEQILEVRTQVVAGLNYALRLRLSNGEEYQTVVWRKLDGSWEVTQPLNKTPLQPLCPAQ